SFLAQRARLHCACTKPRRSRRLFTWRSRPRIASKSKLSIARLWGRVAKTMVHLVCARTTTRTTMQLSSLDRTGTTSKWFATKPRANMPEWSISEAATEEELAVLSEGVLRVGRALAANGNARPLACFLRDGASIIAGGSGRTEFDRLFVQYLWVAEEHRC